MIGLIMKINLKMQQKCNKTAKRCEGIYKVKTIEKKNKNDNINKTLCKIVNLMMSKYERWEKFNMGRLFKRERGITLIALVVTILFSYDEKLKCSNSKGFLLSTIQ